MKKGGQRVAPFSQIGLVTMSINDGCDTSTNEFEFSVRNSKLPPGGGRAAAGGSAKRRRAAQVLQPSQQRRAKWLAVVSLGGADDRFAVQLGKRVVFVDGALSLRDLITILREGHARGGDET